MRVVKKAKIDIETVKITPTTEGALLPKPGDPFSLIVRLQNVGYGDADYTSLELQGCPLEGNNKAFVGNLKRFEDSPCGICCDRSGKRAPTNASCTPTTGMTLACTPLTPTSTSLYPHPD